MLLLCTDINKNSLIKYISTSVMFIINNNINMLKIYSFFKCILMNTLFDYKTKITLEF
ncbi:Uncharacterized protein dnl_33040 [Desulfonema limicola]|uniref:Uncharacterized protein n=1 Tax=Desulfonema limicola TaxID=45656 RepID=A0A975B8P3_9BACT|nr:Uncharacterized protein dnl_33040 [Desulfonema limicola]